MRVGHKRCLPTPHPVRSHGSSELSHSRNNYIVKVGRCDKSMLSPCKEQIIKYLAAHPWSYCSLLGRGGLGDALACRRPGFYSRQYPGPLGMNWAERPIECSLLQIRCFFLRTALEGTLLHIVL